MKVLIDTHIFLWAIVADERLTAQHRQVYEGSANEICLSIASVWEIIIKCGTKKLVLPTPVADFVGKQIERNRITLLPLRLVSKNCHMSIEIHLTVSSWRKRAASACRSSAAIRCWPITKSI
jgi:PIN domain nuclease of toxin-antitoxin system